MKTVTVENLIDPDMPVSWNRAMHNAWLEVATIALGRGVRVRRRVWGMKNADGQWRYHHSAAPRRP